jgi:hypothetical protein
MDMNSPNGGQFIIDVRRSNGSHRGHGDHREKRTIGQFSRHFSVFSVPSVARMPFLSLCEVQQEKEETA